MDIYEEKKSDTLKKIDNIRRYLERLYIHSTIDPVDLGYIQACITAAKINVKCYWHPEWNPITVDDMLKEGPERDENQRNGEHE